MVSPFLSTPLALWQLDKTSEKEVYTLIWSLYYYFFQQSPRGHL